MIAGHAVSVHLILKVKTCDLAGSAIIDILMSCNDEVMHENDYSTG